MVNHYTTSILSTLEKHAPLVYQRKRQRRPCPWLTEELVSAVRRRNKLRRLLAKQTADPTVREQHRIARLTARKLDWKLRNQYLSNQCQTNDQRKLWRVMNTVTGRRKQQQVPQTSISELSRIFGEVVYDPRRPATLKPPAGPVQAGGLETFQSVPVTDVAKCLQAVDPPKAMGSDNLPGIILQRFAHILAPNLTKIINRSLTTGKVPDTFKISHVSPLFKSGDPSIPKNYRPVSLLPIISRILEVMVKRQVMAHLDSHHLMPVSQFAYRKNHSTEDALVVAVNRWYNAKSARKHTGVVFVDMSKAFDSVKHERMLLELFSLGIAGIPLLWFCSYLSGRFQHIKVLDQLSDATACSRGVPQGSVLGPMLFVLYTKDICRILPNTVCHQEFADDIVIDISDENPTIVCNALTAAVTSLANWLHEIGLLLNSQKTQLLFMKPRTSPDFNPKVYCGADLLTVTASANYLGVVVDSDLSWDYHIAHIGRKTARTIGQLWCHVRALSLRARRTWLLSMIVSQICYGSNSFFPGLSVRLFYGVEKQFKAGVRATLQQRRLTPTAPLLDLLGIAGLRRQMQAKILVLVYRCLNNLASPLLQNPFQRTTSGHTPDRHSITRGQASNLLRIPFLHGPACHASIVFEGSLLWNSLPAEARSKRTI